MVTVVMTTYNPEPRAPRFEYAVSCLTALRFRLNAPELHLILADDGSPDTSQLQPIVNLVLPEWASATYITGPHNGIGASLNRALDYVVGPWLYTTDDWLLLEELDLELPLWLLTQGYDLVRLGPIHPNITCATRFTASHGWWLELDPAQGGYCFATRPFLAAPSLVDKVGLFDEGLNAYETERLYNQRCRDFRGDVVRYAAINLAGPWEHIGEYEVGDRPISNEKGAP